MRFSPQTLVVALLAVTLICALKLANCSAWRKHRAGFSGIDRTKSEGEKGADLFHQRLNIAGIVAKTIDSEAVEVRNQTHPRLIIRLDQINTVA